MNNYQLECFRHGFTGKTEPHPLRRVQALIRAHSADAEAIARWLVICDIKAELAAEIIDD